MNENRKIEDALRNCRYKGDALSSPKKMRFGQKLVEIL